MNLNFTAYCHVLKYYIFLTEHGCACHVILNNYITVCCISSVE